MLLTQQNQHEKGWLLLCMRMRAQDPSGLPLVRCAFKAVVKNERK